MAIEHGKVVLKEIEKDPWIIRETNNIIIGLQNIHEREKEEEMEKRVYCGYCGTMRRKPDQNYCESCGYEL
jgi:hypothetical protein